MFRSTMRAIFIASILAMSFSTAFALERLAVADGVTPLPGTYKVETTPSVKACTALCTDDRNSGAPCRGTMTYQTSSNPDRYLCHLNNGLGEGSPFAVKPPAPWTPSQALSDLNDYRAGYGLGPLTLNQKLTQASDAHSQDLASDNRAAHEGSDGSSPSDRIQRQGYYYSVAAENVATGQRSWPAVFDAWQKSEGHNENLLLADAEEFGIAMVYDPSKEYVTFWTMLVAAPMPGFTHDPDAATPEQLRMMGQ